MLKYGLKINLILKIESKDDSDLRIAIKAISFEEFRKSAEDLEPRVEELIDAVEAEKAEKAPETRE